jgi:hypothetical protein
MLTATLFACTATPPKVAVQAPKPIAAAPHADTAGKPPYLNSVGCVDISMLNTTNTPTEILLGSRDCVDKKDFDRAVRLFAVAGAYGSFDSQRVPDVSAHEVIHAFQVELFGGLDSATTTEFQAAYKKITASQELRQMCEQTRGLGRPTYYPTYMTMHGMGAFQGPDPGLKRRFDGAAAWESALADYLHCPAAQ